MTYRVAFDLDDTLLSAINEFPYEAFPPPRGVQWLGFEPLRAATKQVFKNLKANRVETWIYTSSFRSEAYIRCLFWLYGIRLDGVVNGALHKKRVKNLRDKPSKFPLAFGIDLLVDNSEGVKIEGKRYGFDVLHIQPQDQLWHQLVENKVNEILR
ncbi:MAG TPA: hypothetical protein DCS93_25270 [Microscillaceae bacterium]|nr:hypothetical protein [Microscillaceae bacterium]